jgi:hypothetical protein
LSLFCLAVSATAYAALSNNARLQWITRSTQKTRSAVVY